MRAMNCRSTLLLALAALALAGCPDRVVPVEVRIVNPRASGVGPDPFQGVTHLRFRVLGADGAVVEYEGERLERVAERDAGSTSFESLPSGRPLRLQVAGFNGHPQHGGSELVSVGLSARFTVPEEKTSETPPVKVSVSWPSFAMAWS
mgnify:FL=1